MDCIDRSKISWMTLIKYIRQGMIRLKILIAEDERDLADALEAILKHKGYVTEAVYSGTDALHYLQVESYDLALLDIMMPGLSGLEVLEKIRAEENSIPVLLLTARSQLEDKVTGFRAGADDYLTKPFAMEELLVRIEALLRRPRDSYEDNPAFGDISLHRSDFTMRRDGGGEVSLTKKEFQLMEMFLRNTGQVLSKEMLMDNVWGFDSEAEINVVWVNISQLRKKLKELGSQVTIVAQRGLGYRLEE